MKFESCATEILLQIFLTLMPKLCPLHHWRTETQVVGNVHSPPRDLKRVWTLAPSSFPSLTTEGSQCSAPQGLSGHGDSAQKYFLRGLTHTSVRRTTVVTLAFSDTQSQHLAKFSKFPLIID